MCSMEESSGEAAAQKHMYISFTRLRVRRRHMAGHSPAGTMDQRSPAAVAKV